MRIKGTSIASLLGFLEAEYGKPRLGAFVATLDPALKKRCEGLVLASAFYPFEELEALAVKARAFFGGDSSFYERSGAYNAAFGLGGVHQALLARPTPLDFVRAAERSWSQFVDSGSVSADIVGDGRVRVKIEGLPRSEVLCARITGFLTRSLGLARAQELAVTKAACTRKGSPACEWQLVWNAEKSPRPHTLTTAIRRPVMVQSELGGRKVLSPPNPHAPAEVKFGLR